MLTLYQGRLNRDWIVSEDDCGRQIAVAVGRRSSTSIHRLNAVEVCLAALYQIAMSGVGNVVGNHLVTRRQQLTTLDTVVMRACRWTPVQSNVGRIARISDQVVRSREVAIPCPLS